MKTDPITPEQIAAPSEEHLRQLDLEAVECISFGTPCEVSASTLMRLIAATRRSLEYEAFFKAHGRVVSDSMTESHVTDARLAGRTALEAILSRFK